MLHAAGYLLACVTNKTAHFTKPLLQATALDAFFPVVISGDSTARKKPAADPVELACSRLGVEPSEALMVGDSTNDALAARAAGCAVVLVPYGYSEGTAVQSIESDGIVSSVLHVAGLLTSQS